MKKTLIYQGNYLCCATVFVQASAVFSDSSVVDFCGNCDQVTFRSTAWSPVRYLEPPGTTVRDNEVASE